MDEYACTVYSLISERVRMDAEDRMQAISLQQLSGQITKEQRSNADKSIRQLKLQSSDILESDNEQENDIGKLRQIFGQK